MIMQNVHLFERNLSYSLISSVLTHNLKKICYIAMEMGSDSMTIALSYYQDILANK